MDDADTGACCCRRFPLKVPLSNAFEEILIHPLVVAFNKLVSPFPFALLAAVVVVVVAFSFKLFFHNR